MSDRHRAFVDAFLGPAKFNATAAARMCGYTWPGKQGHRLMQRPDVNAAVEAGFRRLLEASERRRM